MLVLTRGTEETIDLTIPASDKPTIVQIIVVRLRCQKGVVQLGFTAPPEVTIDRSEVTAMKAAKGSRANKTAHAAPKDRRGKDSGLQTG